jgi:hypothetical protein
MAYFSVLILAFFEFWLAYPAAFALQIDWVPATLLIAVASSLGTLCAIRLGCRLREWLTRRLGRDGRIGRRTGRVLDRWGTPGIGLLAPLILGPVVTSLGAIVLGAEPRRLSVWMLVGIWGWAVALYVCIRFAGGLDWLPIARR